MRVNDTTPVSQTRLSIDGKRYYNCNGVPKPLPSVTTILSSTQTEETRKKLAAWNLSNPGALEKAASRGTWIHSATENHIRGLRVEPPSEYLPYWKDVPETLDDLLKNGKVLWSESPFNQPQWHKYVGDDGVGRLHYYDDKTEQGYAGCPDLIYKDENNEIVLADFKTSTSPYSLKFPKANSGIPDNVRKALISGVFKAKKTMLQMAAYSLAAEKCLGVHVDKTRIIVSTPLPDYSVQVFSFSRKELEKHMEMWLQVLRQFYENA
jgi:hypothetical protein